MPGIDRLAPYARVLSLVGPPSPYIAPVAGACVEPCWVIVFFPSFASLVAPAAVGAASQAVRESVRLAARDAEVRVLGRFGLSGSNRHPLLGGEGGPFARKGGRQCAFGWQAFNDERVHSEVHLHLYLQSTLHRGARLCIRLCVRIRRAHASSVASRRLLSRSVTSIAVQGGLFETSCCVGAGPICMLVFMLACARPDEIRPSACEH